MSDALRPQPMTDDEVSAMVQRARKEPKPPPEPRTRKPHTCKRCGTDGHNIRTCGAPERARTPGPSRSDVAALLARDEGLTLKEAADRRGISHQAVQQAWARLFPNVPVPTRLEMGWRRLQVISLVVDGATPRQAAEIAGVHAESAYYYCRGAGLRFAYPSHEERGLVDEATMAVARGVTLVDAAIDAGIDRDVLRRALRKRGIQSTATARGRKDGRGARAWALVEQGVPIPEAARRERVAASALYARRSRERAQASEVRP